MSESSRKALVVPIELKVHGNADSLSLVEVDGFQVVVNTADWAGHDKAVYLEPETVVDTTRSEFAFLHRPGKSEKQRITAKRFRGAWSLGLLVPAPQGMVIGDDAWEFLGLEHYDPEEGRVQSAGGPPFVGEPSPEAWKFLPKYDVENLRKYVPAFQVGELVGVTEKLHGANCSVVYSGGEYHVRSRTHWRNKESEFWRGVSNSPNLLEWLKNNPDHLVQGEVVGGVKGFSYGQKPGELLFRAFDIRLPNLTYYGVEEFWAVVETFNIPSVPKIGPTLRPFDLDALKNMAEGVTHLGGQHIREGIVVRPKSERTSHLCGGRLILKLVSNKYLEKQ